ncbi:hypothetical protein DM860_008284 [Cuscuta australis]|uniref:SBP-type domain-containing protein n=1 Tax=Cuscuta australis TaxID=267555 RepID=A0A328D414_9ASTE|nr:hypothetical protein DM860_008284 [Cuscuta australis]
MDSMSYTFEERGYVFSENVLDELQTNTTFTMSGSLLDLHQKNSSPFHHTRDNYHDLHDQSHEVEELVGFGLSDVLHQKSPTLCSDDPCLIRVSSSRGDDYVIDHNNDVNDFGGQLVLSSGDIEAWLPRDALINMVSEPTTPTTVTTTTTPALFPHEALGVTNFESHDCNPRLGACKKAKSICCQGSLIEGSEQPSSKKPRIASFSSQQPLICQVHGCSKDLTTSKDYHKRHRVCDEHSKTTRVVVDGIEQRFCQQCSRFHLLTEFDDDKRSCRKSLAGHNERRRKPHYEPHNGATRFFGMNSQTSHFFIPELLLPAGNNKNYFCQETAYEVENSMRPIMVKTNNKKSLEENHISFSTTPQLQQGSPGETTHHYYSLPKDLPLLHAAASLAGLSQFQMNVDFGNNPTSSLSSVLRGLTGDEDLLCPAADGVIETDGNYCRRLLDDGAGGVYYENETDEGFQSEEGGGGIPTIDLQQLSTHLHRVEQQRKALLLL